MTRRNANQKTLEILGQLERKVLWLSCWMIHNANHLRTKIDGLKVGGHQASCASSVSLMTALYFATLRPQDRVAVKPHAAPVFHAIQYLLERQTQEQLENFRGYGGAQSYPSRTKDHDDVDFSTGSVGLGVAFTAFASIVQDYVQAKPWAKEKSEGRMIALVGDAELDEGNIYECLLEGWKQGLRNTWWIIDYNRQSLDGVVREGLYDRIEDIFRAFGWDVVTLKYGALQRQIFKLPGGAHLRTWIDSCPNSFYAALTFQGGAAWRRRLTDDLAGHHDAMRLLKTMSDDELAQCMENLGGHCLSTIIDAFAAIDHSRPVVFIAYTTKGWGTPMAGHKDNHAGLMSPKQMAEFQKAMGVPAGEEWEPFAGIGVSPTKIKAFLADVPFNARRRKRCKVAPIPVPAHLPLTDSLTSTQTGFGKLLDALARGNSPLADRIVTMSPDVTVSTNLGPWVNRRNLFARSAMADVFRDEQIPSVQKWRFTPEGQHLELGIAEMNLFLLLGAAGLSHNVFGERLFPIGTLYDPFISRGLDALNYACYQGARFILVATPSGISLAPEGGAHQSIATPLIGMSQDGLASFEPAFVDELALIMNWAFDYMQRDGEHDPDEQSWLRDETGGSVYFRLSTRPLEQPKRAIDDTLGKAMIEGAYWMRPPGPNCELVIAYQGTVAGEAIAAAGLIGEYRREIGVLAVTSSDRLHAGWQAASRARIRGSRHAKSHVERLLAPLPPHCTIVTVIDGHPATLSWLGSVRRHKAVALGVEHFGQSGTIPDLYRHFGVDVEGIVAAVESEVPGRSMPLSHSAIRLAS